MQIFRAQSSVSLTHQIDPNSYMCLQGGTTSIHKIHKPKYNTLAKLNMRKL